MFINQPLFSEPSELRKNHEPIQLSILTTIDLTPFLQNLDLH